MIIIYILKSIIYYIERIIKNMLTTYDIFIRLFVALILGGLIGIEREGIRRPAGLRTHILVCVSSALVMLSGIYLSDAFVNRASVDPARLGAQVISGIGFLGAGTILKGSSGVKGLTTAASLWSVAGIGIACGIGFYWGAIICTALILFALMVFANIEKFVKTRARALYIEISCENELDSLDKIVNALNDMKIKIKNLETTILNNKSTLELRFLAILPRACKPQEIINTISNIAGINSIKME
jgi:putative Mg2+ transporter-C (MgtC) family protein